MLQIPNGCEIKSATLSLYALGMFLGAYPNTAKSAYVVTTNWDEYSVTWDVGAPWNKSGGDFSNTSEVSNSNTLLNVWEDYDVTEAVRSFNSNEIKNYGFILKLTNEGVDGGVAYVSSEYIRDINLRPKLTIVLDLPSEVQASEKPYGNNKFTIKKSNNYYWINLREKERVSLDVYNVQGKLVFSTIEQEEKCFKIPLPTNGCFLIKITIDNKIYSKRIVNSASRGGK